MKSKYINDKGFREELLPRFNANRKIELTADEIKLKELHRKLSEDKKASWDLSTKEINRLRKEGKYKEAESIEDTRQLLSDLL